MVRKWILSLTVAVTTGDGTGLSPPVAAQSIYGGIDAGSSSPVAEPSYQSLTPDSSLITGSAPSVVIVSPTQPNVVVAPLDSGVGLSSPGMTQGYGIIQNPYNNSLQLTPDVNDTMDRGNPFFDVGGS